MATILLVDDDPKTLRPLRILLETEGYRVLTALDGKAAESVTEVDQPDLIVTDWMMPDFSGLQLCEHIRADAKRGYTYIIVVTAKSEKDSVVKGLAAGADDYLTKPFDPEELLARVGVGSRTVELHREIAAKVARVAHIGCDHFEQVATHLAAVVEPQWGDPQALLPDIGRRSIVGAVSGAADVALMRAVDRPKTRPLTLEDRHKCGQVG